MQKTVRVLGVVVGVFFLFAGGSKLAGMPPHPEHFAAWGYPDWFRLFVGAWEVAFGGLFLQPAYALYAGAGLGVGMIGAILTELTRGDAPRALFPLVVMLIVGWVTYSRQARVPTGR